ncbi:MAG: three-Cys-motif partner protein TcmP [Candidatus Binatus sp.]|uniref:three-Cys-motif partner protein TcmP n=1 Tax=Candidatus Binatus sp. TaxID=2811406 RepID=UPI00271FC668|nr:three-Cys-motif partner protein TcmP [Candidatus Binatus sp.]MDO8434954.1 three-Cys-motif partner protein TcmP [Candidatus Binatus sp.]
MGNLSEEDLYIGREQTLVKHLILRKYLERFAHKVGSKWACITYIDCFAGPWNVQSSKLSDSSFSIALEELRKARATQLKRGHVLRLRCFFLERDPGAYEQLQKFTASISDIDVKTLNGELEGAVGEILSFVRDGGSGSFPFVFIDPTGWTGFAMNTIEPILKLHPVEVLINFMTGHIRRFLDSPQKDTQDSFTALFGSETYRKGLEGLTGVDRDEEAVRLYSENVKRVGGFDFVSSAIVLHPEINRTHFHLICATRHPEGMAVFKESEKMAMQAMESARAAARQRRRIDRSANRELFSAGVMNDSDYYDSLRQRFIEIGLAKVEAELAEKGRVPHDILWQITTSVPMVWESDLKDWIRDWISAGKVRLQGLVGRQRVPQRGKNVLVILQKPIPK